MEKWLRALGGVGLILAILSTMSVRVWAHSGAPYPIFLESKAGPYTLTVLADPDVGVGTFYITGTSNVGVPLSHDLEVTVEVWPEDGHTSPSVYMARYEVTRDGGRYVAYVPFDAEGKWAVRIHVQGEEGEGTLTTTVRVTPPGVSWLGSLLCFVPFLGLGGLWIFAALRKTR